MFMKSLSLLFYKALVCFLVVLTIPVIMSSCEDDNTEEPDNNTGIYHQTVLMYLPWSGGSIYNYFLNNISSFETAIKKNKGLDGNALVVFISENSLVMNSDSGSSTAW